MVFEACCLSGAIRLPLLGRDPGFYDVHEDKIRQSVLLPSKLGDQGYRIQSALEILISMYGSARANFSRFRRWLERRKRSNKLGTTRNKVSGPRASRAQARNSQPVAFAWKPQLFIIKGHCNTPYQEL